MTSVKAAAGPPAEDGAGGHLLLVEDDQDTRSMLAMGLELSGYRVSQVENGRQALDLLQAGQVRPGLLLLDLMMPEMDGLELLARLGADPRLAGIPVVLLSGDGDSRSSPRAARAVGFLRKPVGMPRLLRTVARHLKVEPAP